MRAWIFGLAVPGLFWVAAVSGENEAGEKVRAKLFPKSGKVRQYYVLVGQTDKKDTCFLDVDVTDTHMRFDLEYKKELNLSPNQSGFITSQLIIFSKSEFGDINKGTYSEKGTDLEITRTQTTGPKTNPDESNVSKLNLKLANKASDARGIRDAILLNTRTDKIVPALSHSKTRVCSGMKVLTVIDDQEGRALADAAAEKWNTSNPKKRQTGEVMFLGCTGDSARSVRCLASGEGEGDGDEPYLDFRYRVEKDGTLSLLTSAYKY